MIGDMIEIFETSNIQYLQRNIYNFRKSIEPG